MTVERVLVIDDEDELRAFLTRLLVMEGYQVSAAGNGREGLALEREGNPDFVFIDLALTLLSVRE